MQKPVNKFAVALWVLTAVMIIGDALLLASSRDNTLSLFHEAGEGYLAATILWGAIRADITTAALLAALGVIIELLDQIRWNAKFGAPT